MDLMDAIRARRSIRKYKSDPVAKEHLDRILEAARLAPSGVNAQPWKFKVVTDPVEKERVFNCTKAQHQILHAPAVIIICADTMSYSKSLKARFKDLLDAGILSQSDLNQMGLDVLTEDEESELAKYAEKAAFNTAIATEHMALTAASLGLGTCWIHLFDKDALSKIYDLPSWIFPVTLLPVGYADEDPEARPRKALEEITF